MFKGLTFFASEGAPVGSYEVRLVLESRQRHLNLSQPLMTQK